jgi:hypothetical protein
VLLAVEVPLGLLDGEDADEEEPDELPPDEEEPDEEEPDEVPEDASATHTRIGFPAASNFVSQ